MKETKLTVDATIKAGIKVPMNDILKRVWSLKNEYRAVIGYIVGDDEDEMKARFRCQDFWRSGHTLTPANDVERADFAARMLAGAWRQSSGNGIYWPN